MVEICVSGIFHGIPLESDRRCSACRNGQITEDVRKLSSTFLEVTNHFFTELVEVWKIFCLSNSALFPCLQSLI